MPFWKPLIIAVPLGVICGLIGAKATDPVMLHKGDYPLGGSGPAFEAPFEPYSAARAGTTPSYSGSTRASEPGLAYDPDYGRPIERGAGIRPGEAVPDYFGRPYAGLPSAYLGPEPDPAPLSAHLEDYAEPQPPVAPPGSTSPLRVVEIADRAEAAAREAARAANGEPVTIEVLTGRLLPSEPPPARIAGAAEVR